MDGERNNMVPSVEGITGKEYVAIEILNISTGKRLIQVCVIVKNHPAIH
jgi:hypothetical protein